ncbi:ATP-binding protein [Microbacterium sp. RU33B]|uniref:sensor histidine kinase n=1 Tax=Microbacterium sp. RU33B TaxID=1907390 RepID=UPI0009677D66|nr:ATP-binding protein [Microbacterium sp. RU33B]SIT68219.1 Signal transduction histidine kinase [Microbacterium sp. RU33B]
MDRVREESFRIQDDERLIGWLLAIGGTAGILIWGPAMWQIWIQRDSWWIMLALATAVGVVVLSAAGMVLPDRLLILGWSLTVVLGAAATFLARFAHDEDSWAGVSGVSGLVLPIVALPALLLPSAWAAVTAGLIYVAPALAGLVPPVILPAHTFVQALEDGVVIFVVTLIIGVRSRSRAVSALERKARSAQREEAVRAERSRQQRALQRVIHDDVLSTLIAALHADALVGDRIRESAQQALAAIEAGSRPHTAPVPWTASAWSAELCAQARREHPGIHFSVALDLSSVPRDVGDSFVGATKEAARNVRRHAGEDAPARLSVTADRTGISVVVDDGGRGFSPAAVPLDRMGVNGSIVNRLRAVGGDAVVRSVEGRGTRVEMTWIP